MRSSYILILLLLFASCRNASRCDAYGRHRKSVGHRYGFSSGGSVTQYGAYSSSPNISTPGEAGKITAGELNDLSDWEFWSDISDEELTSNQELWKVKPSDRLIFSVQNENTIPLIGAKIELFAEGSTKPIWISRSDNTGFAQLFGRYELDDSLTQISYAKVTYNNESIRIDAPKKLNEGVNKVQFNADCEPSDLVDIAFVVDATGSMQDEIDFLKKDLLDIIESSLQENNNVQINLASLFYRCEGNSYVTKKSDFSNDLSKTIDFIKEQNADEGGDEVVSKALKESINNLKWRDNARTRLLFIVLDEPPGAQENVIDEMKEVYKDAAAKGIKIIPCVASGTSLSFDRRLEYLMRVGAILTNGTYVFFTNDSGIGNDHTLPIVESFEVEKLNALLKRIIASNISVTSCESEAVDQETRTESGNNQDDQLQIAMDSIFALGGDSLQIMHLLPYTDYATYEEFNENRPVSSIDTLKLLQDHQLDVLEWKVFPNPTFGEVTVETNTTIDAINLLDMHGRLLQHVEPGDRLSSNLDLSTYPKGTYIIVMLNKEQKLSARILKI